jgi:hypothetical protein
MHLMHNMVASCIMRTTVDIDAPVLKQLKQLQRRERKSLGRIVSDLLAAALAHHHDKPKPPFQWTSQHMGARVDLADNDAIYTAMEPR